MAMVAPELDSTDALHHTLVADDILPKCEESVRARCEIGAQVLLSCSSCC